MFFFFFFSVKRCTSLAGRNESSVSTAEIISNHKMFNIYADISFNTYQAQCGTLAKTLIMYNPFC